MSYSDFNLRFADEAEAAAALSFAYDADTETGLGCWNAFAESWALDLIGPAGMDNRYYVNLRWMLAAGSIPEGLGGFTYDDREPPTVWAS
jgi:hypothetical protein